jgi:hypothetical protein
VIGVEDAIDIHCHAHEGQQDALGVGKLASKSGMFGVLYKTIVGRKDPAAAAGLWLNFTYDELSPLLSIDPARMYEAIRTVGPEHCTLSSDAGEPLFPNSVESLRLLRGHMAAFGCTPDEIYTMSTLNPSLIVGVDVSKRRASAA